MSALRVAFSGFFFDCSGFGESARRMLRALQTVGADVVPGMALESGANELPSPPAWLREFLERPAPTTSDPAGAHLVSVAANEFPLITVPAARKVGMTCWETDTLHVSYVSGCAGLDRVIVPSRFNADVFRAAGIDAAVVPFPVAEPVSTWEEASGGGDALGIPEISDAAYVFYSVLTWQERKNPRGLLTAYLTAFSGYDDVVLVLKVNGPKLLKGRIEQEIDELVEAINRPNPPRVHVVVDAWPESKMWALHRRGDCFVLLTRGESFTLPALDALTAGNRVIITDWGGHLEFVIGDDGVPRDGVELVRSRLTPVIQRFHYFTGDQCWADPDILHAADLMREAFKDGRWLKRRHAMPHLAPAVVGTVLVEALGGH